MAKTDKPAAKTPKCPVSREQFTKEAKPGTVTVDIGGKKHELLAGIKHFESGSEGWYGGGKIIVTLDGIPCEAQVGINITLIGSKDLPK